MPKALATNGAGFLGRLVDFWVLTPARDARSLAERPWRVPDERAAPGAAEILPNRMASIGAADLEHSANALDAVAGSEFVDDRIRLRE